jgi:DNA-binding NarL/FixJ family response regulator
MKILLVEDTQFKIEKIIDFLKEQNLNEVTIKESYNSALKEISTPNINYDLIILDISIPIFDISNESIEFMPSGGKSLFNQIYMNDLASKVVVVTLFKSFDDGSLLENLHTQFSDEYPDNYLGYIIFNSHDLKWQKDLSKIINNL